MADQVTYILHVKIPCKRGNMRDLINNVKIHYGKLLLNLFIFRWLLER